jgi:two-component system, NtrC family, response regulator HydG
MGAAPRILILDDEVALVDALTRHFQRRGYEPTQTYLVADAVQAIEKSVRDALPFDAVITDLQLPDGDGRTIVRLAREMLPRCPVVMMTGSRSISGTVDAIRLGAVTVLEKPVAAETLEKELRQAMASRADLDKGVDAAGEAGIIGRSPAIRAVLDVLFLAAPTDATVLIEGETGTGKELVAKALHRLSRRARGPFVAVNCAALPETLVESELFGHAKGAFTGADKPRAGRFREADGGTLFLDEIGEMPLALQSKLLRVIQEGEVQPLGVDKPQPVDVRVVAATNRNLGELAAAGKFRSDLYYRLNVVPLQLPPLRDRREDLAALAGHFLRETGRTFSAEAMASLERYPWPGNVREMENVVARLKVLKPEGDFQLADLPQAIRGAQPLPGLPQNPAPSSATGVDLYAALGELEDRLIREALERSGGNKNQAAQSLGLNRTTLVEKLRKMSRR